MQCMAVNGNWFCRTFTERRVRNNLRVCKLPLFRLQITLTNLKTTKLFICIKMPTIWKTCRLFDVHVVNQQLHEHVYMRWVKLITYEPIEIDVILADATNVPAFR